MKLLLRCAVLLVAAVTIAAGTASTALATSSRQRRPSEPSVGMSLPATMAALGDSITQAFDATPTKTTLKDQPQYSWSTGYAGAKIVDSQYERLLAAGDHELKGHYFNDAVSGTTMGDLLAQATEAVSQHAAYVTILMGANDACKASVSEMTPVATFTSEFKSALEELTKTAHVRVFVASIPNLFKLWQLLHNNSSAELAWSIGHLCQSMLSISGTNATRQEVLKREEAYNAALQTVCKQFPSCRFDQLAVFDYSFTKKQVSSFDFYHPSIAGQNELAALTWGKSYWPTSK